MVHLRLARPTGLGRYAETRGSNMKTPIHNFLILSLIVACVPVMAAPKKSTNKPPQSIAANQEELNTLLYYATYKDETEKIKQLIASGANANTNEGELLRVAACRGNIEICKLLVEHNADLNATDSTGTTALMLAASLGRLQGARHIPEYIEPDAQTFDRYYKTCELLIAAGADTLLKDWYDRTAADIAFRYLNHAKHVKGLKKETIRGYKKIYGLFIGDKILLLDAVLNKKAARVKELLARGADGNEILILMADKGDLEACKLLIKCGANANAYNICFGITPLMIAAQYGPKPEGEEWLPDTYLPLNEVIWNTFTPKRWHKSYSLHDISYIRMVIPADNRHIEICKLLIAAGAQVNTKDYNGQTALYIAMANQNEECCKLLIDHGAEPIAKEINPELLKYVSENIADLEDQNMKLLQSYEHMKRKAPKFFKRS
jgi:ankyrin repeat protein